MPLARARLVAAARLALLLLLAACSVPLPPRPAARPAAGDPTGPADAWQEALAAVPQTTFAAALATGAVPVPPPGAGLLVLDADPGRPPSGWPPEARAALAKFVHDGGRLVLLGRAARHAAALEFEPEWPETTTLRWGFDARAVAGSARVGFQVVSGRLPELFDALPPSGAGDDVAFVAGGAPCSEALCTWSVGVPARGVVLARLAVQRDGANDPLGAPVVVHWQCGKGEVLACGVAPAVAHADAELRAAARAFVARCARWAGARGSLVAIAAPPAVVPAAAPVLPPMAPLLPHWGWQLPQHSDGEERSADELLRDALQPSWLAGADLCELPLAGPDGASSLDWRSGDPLRPAPSFESRLDARHWHGSTFRDFAADAHGRGMLAFGSLDPLPVGERAVERLATLRFAARELACVRRFGAGALDGFGVREWLRDDAGWSLAMLQDFQPAGVLYRLGELAPPIAGALRAADAADGAVAGLPFTGTSAAWRDGFDGTTFPLGVLDACAPVDDLGGSRADWIVTQANDFVRRRQGQGAALWWRQMDPARFDRDTVDYVHGVSLEPLRAAIAMPLAATGADGLRAAGNALVRELPAAFGAHVRAPAAVHSLQNNWFRLLGSGGAFEFDPRGEARFGNDALRLSPSLLRTRLFGGRPDGNAVRSERHDFLAAGTRGEGGYGAVARIGSAEVLALPPALLQRGATPAWPAAMQFDWDAEVGYHELELTPRPVRGRGILTVSLDGVLLRAVPFDGPVGETVVVPVHVARPGQRLLELAVSAGGALALDRLVMRRAGDVGVEAAVTIPAGSCAALVEASQSSYHAERIEFRTVADFPGFVARLRCERAVRNLQVERVLALPGYRELAALGAGDTAAALRQPFVLRAATPGWPDLVVAPLHLGRYEALRWQPGELTWRGAPEAGAQSRLGVYCCPHGEGERWLPHAPVPLAALLDPLLLDVGAGRPATLRSELPVAWTRVVQVAGEANTPFLVREQGEWSWRGTQPAADGTRWLRVHQAPGDTVEIQGGPAMLARTRPGPGSTRLVTLRDVEPGAVTVRVLQASALTTPCVVMASDFAEVALDGESWAHFDGRTVFLPNRPGVHRVVTRNHAGGRTPHVRATRAPLTSCRYLPASRELVLATAGDAERAAELPWTAVLGGPAPIAIENGELVDDGALRFPDAEASAAARAGGVLIRFRNGVCKVRYGE